MKPEPCILEGRFVRLEPMTLEHIDRLWEIGSDVSLWTWTTNNIRTRNDMDRYVREAIGAKDKGLAMPFVTIKKPEGIIVGSTRFGNIDLRNRKAEIGWTWINAEWQRTAINTEAKLLMLTHAFEIWKWIRVEFKTDANNHGSRKAIRRLGALEEGTLRNHMITEGGRFRDSVYFSIIEDEWDEVKHRLSFSLQI